MASDADFHPKQNFFILFLRFFLKKIKLFLSPSKILG